MNNVFRACFIGHIIIVMAVRGVRGGGLSGAISDCDGNMRFKYRSHDGL